MAKEETIKIEGMSCQHCVNHVKKAISDVGGVESVDVSLENKEAKVNYNSDNPITSELKQAVETAGYKVVD